MAKDSGIRVGDVFSRLTVLEIKKGGVYVCKCSCGNIKESLSGRLKDGRNKSCGCLLEETKRFNGMSNSPEYFSYHSMLIRTGYRGYELKNKEKFSKYEGMPVEPTWLDYDGNNGFLKFLEDMGKRPDGTSLDRIDNSKGYFPWNCKWSTDSEQTYNRGLFCNNTSGRTGVYYREECNKWRAKITIDNSTINLGTFENYQDAVLAREEAELKYWGKNKQ